MWHTRAMTEPPIGRPAATSARITLLVRAGCHLCEYARESVSRVAAETGVDWVEIDIDTDAELARDYADRIPVVLVDGREHDYFRVDEQRLTRALAGVAS